MSNALRILLLAAILAAVVAFSSDAAPTTAPIAAWKQYKSPLINSFQVALRIEPDLRAAVLAAINRSNTHNPTNGTQPWDLHDLLAELEKYLYHIDTPDSHGTVHKYGNHFGAIIGDSFWASFDTATRFVRSFVTVKGEHWYSSSTKQYVDAWLADPLINMSDFVVPPGGFQSFGQFFDRDLRPGARPVAHPGDDSVLVSPVDGRVSATIELIDSPAYMINGLKGGMPINISAVLGGQHPADPTAQIIARKFAGGKGMIIDLQAYDYHKWAAACRGSVKFVNRLGSQFWAVPPGEPWFPNLGYHFHRANIVSATPSGARPRHAADFHVASSFIGIAEYSSVTPIVAPGDSIEEKGALIGGFYGGGSMVFLSFDAGFEVELLVKAGEAVKVGQAIARIVKKK